MKKIYFTVIFWGSAIFSKLDSMSGERNWALVYLFMAVVSAVLSLTESFPE